MAEKIPDPRPVHIQDLLRRSPKSVQKEVIKDFFQSRTVLVTGAGGSIGSEICRQILETNPGVLLLLESSEYNLYKIQRELEEKKTSIPIIGIMGNVTDEAFIDHVFLNHRPDYVLHAAAYKHVPLVESNPLSGILNNIEGTKIVANACIRYHVRNFLLVSTDKAVRPTNVMGMTKRACEILVQSLHQLHGHGCRFSAVRFGNVLGSSGSVIPLFMDQIKKGGPVTVTDPEMTRYFMLISEAVGLVLQSAVKSRGGEIFVLDMGDPVNILEMAKQLIRLAGKEPGQDIDIVITGLRPGEKIFEELIIEGAERHELHEDIYIARPENFSGTLALEMIDNLLVYAKGYKTQEALVILADLASNSLHKNFSSPIIVKDLPCISL
jgi:FlaA1/EpsC-like NDP-sugar epimerase